MMRFSRVSRDHHILPAASQSGPASRGVIPANHHDLSVTTEHESAAIESGATDVPTDPSRHG
jgi:hypothetical protein